MWVDLALVAAWIAALIYACWFTWTSDTRDNKAAHRRLIAELNRHIDNETGQPT